MLLRFRVSNFASLRDEQELSLVALDDHADLAVVPVPLTKDAALPVAGIFGPNASGKSNVLKAAIFACDAVVHSHQAWLPDEPVHRWPFRLDDEHPTEPSTFVFNFVFRSTRYEYGFSLDDVRVREEWLYSWPRGKRQRLFERSSGTPIEFGPSLTGAKAAIADLVRDNSLFLSAAAANNHAQLRPLATWFRNWRSISSSDPTGGMPPNVAPDDGLMELVKFADVGIVGSTMVDWQTIRLLRPSRGRAEGPPPFPGEYRLELVHRAATPSGQQSLPWSWESSGTQSWLHVAGAAAFALESGGVLSVDDLGSTLHPALTAQLVGLFQQHATNPRGAQLIFTGHDVSLLGRHVSHRLHRDQVWLVAKDQVGASTVYPLTEYGRVRDGLDDIEGRYLQGRYGAVPFFDSDLLASLRSAATAT